MSAHSITCPISDMRWKVALFAIPIRVSSVAVMNRNRAEPCARPEGADRLPGDALSFVVTRTDPREGPLGLTPSAHRPTAKGARS
ncbi:hypothetical protein F558DRAFT_04229 [Streptomyces sp. AmelKG-A3]|nr:hypothetical protein YUMDRAFT_03487 [Streptomyces sp. OspMP-M45]SCD29915.1 hypothetical protein GA0115241_100717 [Streptomyces sp. DpondAA-D4]SCD54981.1 hypothetical protein GA0115249_105375 [Streptomyces sp. PpalLS-921]SCE35330.1 hypothetical protein GA0115247_13327 [Streptomyces sp. PalvLS-984]SDD50817.1 hypothetical protein F558DRAFT_04229 [Streptomyces sp. AmelKG-A3]